MKKVSTLLLSALVAVGSVLTSDAAPVVHRAVNNPLAASAAMDIPGNPMKVASLIPGIRPSALQKTGIRSVVSPTAVRRARAQRSATAASRAMAPNINLCGQVFYGLDGGFYALPHADGEDFTLLSATQYELNYGGYFDAASGLYRGVYANVSSTGSVSAIYNIAYNPQSEGVVEGTPLESVGMMAAAVAQDPTDGSVYGYYYNDNGSGFVWAKADYAAGTRTPLADFAGEDLPVLMACDNAGQFYAIDSNSVLYKVDKTDGSLTKIAQSNLPYYYSVGCVINPATHTMIATCNTYDEAGIYEVDLETGAATRLVDFGKDVQVANLYLAASEFSDKSPAAPGLTVTAPEGSMTVHYAITIPDQLMDGTPVTGALDWQITMDGQTVFEGRNQAGAVVEGDLEVSKTGMTEFAATASTPDGVSPKTIVRIFVGEGLPAAPSNVKASFADGKMSITWNAVTGSEDGGYVNPAEITYSVISGGNFIAKDLTATSYEFEMEEPVARTEFTYFVMAFYKGRPSEMGTSNTLVLGSYTAPYAVKFDSTKALTNNGYTVFDVNGDKKLWRASTNGVYYTYSNKNVADDWVVSPEIYLEAGKVYEVSIDVYGRGRTSTTKTVLEKIEVKAGKAEGATVSTIGSLMDMEVIPVTEVTNFKDDPRTVTGLLAPTETGRLNIGIHAVSDKNMDYLHVTSLRIGEGMDPSAPKAATDLAVTPEATGLHKAEIALTAPAQTVAGQPIDGNVTFKVTRNGEEVKTISAAAGAAISFTDEVPELGTYTYALTSYSGDVKGGMVSATAFVGPYPAAHPANVQMFGSYQPGTVTLVWDAVTTDVNGTAMPKSNFTYMVYGADAEGNLVAKLPAKIAANTATFKAIDNLEKQEFVQYIVYAYNREAESKYGTTTDLIPVGKPYDMPFTVSNVDDLQKFLIGTDGNGARWAVFGDEKFKDVKAQDGDGQYFASETDTQNKTADLFSGRINITASERPELSFYVMKAADDDLNMLDVLVKADGTEDYLPTVNMADIDGLGWTKVRYDLSKYAGKNIQVTLRSIHKNKVWVLVDNIRVQETPDCDVALLSLTAPAVVKANEKFDITAQIASFGYLPARNFSVKLYRDGKELESRPVSSLEPDEKMTVVFENVVSLFDENTAGATYYAEIVIDGDKDAANNRSLDITVERPVSTFDAVADLNGEIAENGNKLTWTSVYGQTPEPVEITEDFENAESWAHNYGQWTFYDGDREPLGGLEGIELPGIEQGYTTGSFFVFDVRDAEVATPHSGNKFLAALFSYYDYRTDDWAISPLLTGQAQTISFWAVSLDEAYPEKIEVWYTSEESTEVSDFVQDQTFNIKTVPGEWTKYTVDLPAGTKHFAIHSSASYNFMLMIDDVTFTPDPTAGAPELLGYNIYRNGVKLNDAPVTEGEYLDTEGPEGTHTYHVTAVYDRGESELSNAVTLEQSGIAAVAAVSAKVAVEGSDIVVSGAEGLPVSVVAADGKVLHSAAGDARVTASRGVYLVSVGRKTVKVAVK